MAFLPVIMSGGAGERLWPVSRASFPKPFIQMPDGESLLQKAYARAEKLPGASEILTITNREHYFKTRSEYAEITSGSSLPSFVLEPMGRNTAPAIAAAALYARRTLGEDAILLVLPADQLITDQNAFAKAVAQAKILAEKDYLVTFGIHPTRAETGFGYIQLAPEVVEGTMSGYKVKRFVEKPDAQTAEEYLQGGEHVWNAGIFCFKASTFLNELAEHSPEVFMAVSDVMGSADLSKAKEAYTELSADLFAKAPAISVDYAVMEYSRHVAVVTCDIGWSDVGSWNSIGEFMPEDAQGNRIKGEIYTHNSQNCIIQSNDRVVAAIGLKDLVIVDTTDALLVADKNSVQDIKKITARLKEEDHTTSKEHPTVFRPWGCYTVVEQGAGFKIKRIEVLPGQKISLQTHQHRSEHWVVISGVATVQNNDETYELQPSQSTYIQAGNKHRLQNSGEETLVIVEVQCGPYLGEDDIKRLDDSYGRTDSEALTA